HWRPGWDPVEQLDDVGVAHPDAADRTGRAHRDRVGTPVDIDVAAHRVDVPEAVLPPLAAGQPQNARKTPAAARETLAELRRPELARRPASPEHRVRGLPGADLGTHGVLAPRRLEAPFPLPCPVTRRRDRIALQLLPVVREQPQVLL